MRCPQVLGFFKANGWSDAEALQVRARLPVAPALLHLRSRLPFVPLSQVMAQYAEKFGIRTVDEVQLLSLIFKNTELLKQDAQVCKPYYPFTPVAKRLSVRAASDRRRSADVHA